MDATRDEADHILACIEDTGARHNAELQDSEVTLESDDSEVDDET